MDILGIILGVLGIAITVAIAVWQHSKAKSAERHFEELTKQLPQTLMNGITSVLQHPPENQGSSPEWSVPGGRREMSPWLQTRYADINNDGHDELLVEVSAGPHSTALLVYGLVAWEFQQIAELYSSTGCGFDVINSDNDGQLEVETVEVAERPGLPYVYGLRDRVTHKLVNGDFVETNRVEGWDESDIERVQSETDSP
ncbi:MAG: hypothetical protein Q7U37_05090 [Gallionella sp.]|nr:hypothetical protein [Gallionella sp.]